MTPPPRGSHGESLLGSSSFRWRPECLDLWPHHSSLCLCSHIACFSSVCKFPSAPLFYFLFFLSIYCYIQLLVIGKQAKKKMLEIFYIIGHYFRSCIIFVGMSVAVSCGVPGADMTLRWVARKPPSLFLASPLSQPCRQGHRIFKSIPKALSFPCLSFLTPYPITRLFRLHRKLFQAVLWYF